MRQVCSDALVLCVLVAAVAASHAAAPADAPPVARVAALKGAATLVRGGTQRPLRQGDQLLAGDIVVSDDGEARLLYSRGNTFDLYPHATITVRNPDSRREMVERWIEDFKTRIGGRMPGERQRRLLYSDETMPSQ